VWQLDLPTSSAVGACWTPGADTFIVALEGGKLHAIDQRNMRVVEEAELNKPCHAIALSGVGPVVTLGNGEARELVLLDPRTLVARSSFPLPASSDVAVGERSPLALVSVPGQGIQLTDIRTGQIVAKADRVPLPNGREDLSLAKATSVCLDASGSYAYAMAEGRLVSLRLSGKSMQLHQLLPPSTGRNGLVTLSGVGISADGLLLDIFGTAKAGHEVHDIRYARDFGTLCRRFTGPTLVVFDCGAGRVLRGGGNRDVAYPFSSSRLDSSINRVIRNPFYPRLGRIVLPHPRGNRLVVVGDRIHVLQYSSGLIR
jgi:hypothetical protein